LSGKIVLREGIYGPYYGTKYNADISNNKSQNFYDAFGNNGELIKKVNAVYICTYLSDRGWTLNAISGVLGNMEYESDLNPGRWQNDRQDYASAGYTGYGLIQWTGYKLYFDLCKNTLKKTDFSSMDVNLEALDYEARTNSLGKYSHRSDSSLGSYNIYNEANTFSSFDDFKTGTAEAKVMAYAFAWNYEKSAVVLGNNTNDKIALIDKRGGAAEKWYKFLENFKLKARAKWDVSTGSVVGLNSPFDLNTKTFKGDLERSAYETDNPFNNMQDSKRPPDTYRMPNCTCYAWGRFYECIAQICGDPNNDYKMTNIKSVANTFGHLSYNSPNRWLDEAEGKFICATNGMNAEPRRGAVIVWTGHVAFVEDVIRDEKGKATAIITSDSGFTRASGQLGTNYVKYNSTELGKTSNGTHMWWAPERKKTPSNWGNGSYNFLGFIYNPLCSESIEVLVAPSELTHATVCNITDQSASIKGTAVWGSPGELTYNLVDTTSGTKISGVFRKSDLNISDTGEFFVSLTKLKPNTKYTLEIYFEESAKKTFTFTTCQSYPQPATNLKLKALNLNLASNNFKFSFKLPDKTSWGYWANTSGYSCGYSIYKIINGVAKTLTEFEHTFSTDAFTLIYEPQKAGAKPGDNFQLGVLTWVKNANGELISDPNGLRCSNSICLKECTHETYIPKLVKG
jgi:hypothetical protein